MTLTTRHLKQKIRPSLEKAHILPLVHYLKTKHYRLLGINRLIRVPVDHLRCQDKPFSELQGFSDKPVAYFPPCQFFKLSLTDPQKAHNAFYQWLRTWLIDKEAFKIPNSEGGWANGSLVREVFQAHQEKGIIMKDFAQADPALIDKAINRRVRHYFGVFNSIKENGFDKLVYPPIYCWVKDDYYVIENGHHRAGALWVLGYRELEVVHI